MYYRISQFFYHAIICVIYKPDHQDLVLAELLNDPHEWLLIPVYQENISELSLKVSAAACFGWETNLVHIQKQKTARQRQ